MALSVLQDRDTTASATSITLEFLNDTVAGSLLVACTSRGAATAQPTSVADTPNGTFTARSSASHAGSAQAVRISAFENGAGSAAASSDITATWAASGTIGITIIEIGDAASSGAFDVENTASGNTTPMTTGNLVTTQADEILIYIGSVRNAPTTITVGANFTEMSNYTANRKVETSYRIVSSTGTYQGTATISPNDDWCAACASFKAKLPTGRPQPRPALQAVKRASVFCLIGAAGVAA